MVVSLFNTHGAKAYIYYQDGPDAPPALARDVFEGGSSLAPFYIYVTLPGWHTIIGRGV